MTRFGLGLALQAAGFDSLDGDDGDLGADMAPVAVDDDDPDAGEPTDERDLQLRRTVNGWDIY